MVTGVSGVVTLEVKDSKVDCPRFGQSITFEDCRLCNYMREQRTHANSPQGGSISGVIVCEYTKFNK